MIINPPSTQIWGKRKEKKEGKKKKKTNKLTTM
jgi:hypothetical protein